MMSSPNCIDHEVERVAVKTICAAQLLEKLTDSAQQLDKLKRRVDRYIRQAQLILTWKRGSGLVKMVGSAAKTVGGVMVVAAPLHPKLSMAVKAGHRLWKFGAGLKVLNAVGNMLREFWGNGCRTALMEFAHCASIFSQNAGILHEVVQDLQVSTQGLNNRAVLDSPSGLADVLSEFIPRDQANFALHVLHILFRNQQYSPLFDFMALTADASTSNQSNMLQVMREVESFRFTEFVEQSDSKPLVAIASFLHVTRELIDFLDGFSKVTDQDCKFLQECLSKVSQESMSIMKVVGLLTNLSKLNLSEDLGSTQRVQHQPDSVNSQVIPIDPSSISTDQNFEGPNFSREIDNLRQSTEDVCTSNVDMKSIHGDNNVNSVNTFIGQDGIVSGCDENMSEHVEPNLSCVNDNDFEMNNCTDNDCEQYNQSVVHRNIKNLFLGDISVKKTLSSVASVIGSSSSHILSVVRQRGGEKKAEVETSQFSNCLSDDNRI